MARMQMLCESWCSRESRDASGHAHVLIESIQPSSTSAEPSIPHALLWLLRVRTAVWRLWLCDARQGEPCIGGSCVQEFTSSQAEARCRRGGGGGAGAGGQAVQIRARAGKGQSSSSSCTPGPGGNSGKR